MARRMTSGELGWYTDDAIVVAEWLLGRGAAIDSAELWLAKNAAVQPHIQASSGVVPYRYSTDTWASETWELFVHRTLKDLTGFVRRFKWPANTTAISRAGGPLLPHRGLEKLAGGRQFSVPDIALERRREISSEANVPNDRGALSES
jgi:hypothetical protein